jgi:hypothetical protein
MRWCCISGFAGERKFTFFQPKPWREKGTTPGKRSRVEDMEFGMLDKLPRMPSERDFLRKSRARRCSLISGPGRFRLSAGNLMVNILFTTSGPTYLSRAITTLRALGSSKRIWGHPAGMAFFFFTCK